MKPKSFNVYLDYIENIEALTDEEVGQLFRALLSYTNTDVVPEMSAIVKVAFTPMRKQIDVEFEHFRMKSEANSENARKRWQMVAEKKDAKKCEEMRSHQNKNKNKEENKELFNEFWTAYPKKVGKQVALRSFDKLNVNREMLDKMLEAIKKQKGSNQWQDSQYIPNPSTWLNQERWNDELPKAKTKAYGNYMQREPVANDRFGMEYLDKAK